jgi:ParB family transcriptional regulator, chromosome partitioning protein
MSPVMRTGKKPPDIANVLPSVRARGILQTLLVRPNCAEGCFKIVAGKRRYYAAKAVAEETGSHENDELAYSIPYSAIPE